MYCKFLLEQLIGLANMRIDMAGFAMLNPLSTKLFGDKVMVRLIFILSLDPVKHSDLIVLPGRADRMAGPTCTQACVNHAHRF